MKKYFELLRIKHWIKNALVILPILCAYQFNTSNLFKIILSFFSFSFITSFVYIINDLKDIEKDKKHKVKKNRPLASGKIKIKVAKIIAIVSFIIAIALKYYLTKNFFDYSSIILIIYAFINLLYSYKLKNVAIIDIFILSFGFLLRIYYGASIFNINVSDWLFLTVLSASLFLGIGKREKELKGNIEVREVLKKYSIEFLNKFQNITITLTIIFYSLWAIEQEINYIRFTIPLVIFIIMKYCLYLEKNDEGDPITILYNDKILLILVAIYIFIMLKVFI